VPTLDYALICDYVRAEGGIAHVIGAGIDTVMAAQVPAGQNLGILIRMGFARSECDRPHRIEIIFQGEDGERLVHLNAVAQPQWPDDQPPGGTVGVLTAINLGIPLPRFGLYSFEVLANDTLVKSIPLRVRQREQEPQPPQQE
jgi:hypothetical protein